MVGATRGALGPADPGEPAGPDRRVVVTGIGVVSAMGRGVQALLDGLQNGRDCARPITAFDTVGFAHANGCQVPDEVADTITVDPALGRAASFAVEAARLAVRDAGVEAPWLAERECAVAIGTTDGESRDLDDLVAQQLAQQLAVTAPDGIADTADTADIPDITGMDGMDGMDVATVARIQPLRLSAAIARDLGLEHAEVITLQTACAAGNYAIGYGYDAIRTGDAEVALSGGADALCRKTFTGFYRLGTIAPDVCRPFDSHREGILTGEGATVLLLESLDSALDRGARIYAEVLGYGLTCDATHPVAPDAAGIARCIAVALERSGVKTDEVDLVSAHGTGTRANDVTEARALRTVFGEELPRVISVKSMIGHSMGAASALGAAASALALAHQFIPPTINHRETDPECAVDCVPNSSITADLSVVQNHGLAFGGNNSVLMLGRAESEWAR